MAVILVAVILQALISAVATSVGRILVVNAFILAGVSALTVAMSAVSAVVITVIGAVRFVRSRVGAAVSDTDSYFVGFPMIYIRHLAVLAGCFASCRLDEANEVSTYLARTIVFGPTASHWLGIVSATEFVGHYFSFWCD